MFEEQDRVGVADRRLEQSVRVGRHAGHDHLQAGHMGVEGLDRLGVVEAAVNPTAERRADDDRHGPVAVGAVARPGCLADDLVESRVDEVGELDLGDGDQAVERRADSDSNDRRLGKGRVEHARLAESRVETLGGAENAALLADVFAQDEHPLVALHLLGHGRAHGFDHAHLRHPENCGA